MQQSPYVKNNKKIFRFLLGDIRDKERLNFAINENIDVVIHTAVEASSSYRIQSF